MVKTVPEGLKSIECEHGMREETTHIHNILEQDLIQDAPKTKTKMTFFKLIFSVSGSEMMVAFWASSTPEFSFICVAGIHDIKQIGLDTKFQKATNRVKNLKINWGIAKDAHSKAKKNHNNKKGKDPSPSCCSKKTIDKAWSMWEEAGAKAEVTRTQILQLYANLLFNNSCQWWDRIIKAQTETLP